MEIIILNLNKWSDGCKDMTIVSLNVDINMVNRIVEKECRQESKKKKNWNTNVSEKRKGPISWSN